MHVQNQVLGEFPVAIANIILGFFNDQLRILLCKRSPDQLGDQWNLPVVSLSSTEDLENVVNTSLEAYPFFSDFFSFQFCTYIYPSDDIKDNCLHIAYLTLSRTESLNIESSGKDTFKWFSIKSIPEMPKTQKEVLQKSLYELKFKVQREPIAFHLLPLKFTIPQLRSLYENLTLRKLDYGNFSKKLHAMNILTRLNEKDKSQSKKGAYYYIFDKEKYENWRKEGMTFELK